MVKVSTLFHRVDGFDENEESDKHPVALDQDKEDTYLNKLLKPLVFDPGDELVQRVLKHI
jgi:hypothetical protein